MKSLIYFKKYFFIIFFFLLIFIEFIFFYMVIFYVYFFPIKFNNRNNIIGDEGIASLSDSISALSK
jgi:hypothetical protein